MLTGLCGLSDRVREFFEQESGNREMTPELQRQDFGRTHEETLTLLAACNARALARCADEMESLRHASLEFSRFAAGLSKLLLNLKLSDTTGRSISAGIPDGDRFTQLLRAVISTSSTARKELEAIEGIGAEVNLVARRWTTQAR